MYTVPGAGYRTLVQIHTLLIFWLDFSTLGFRQYFISAKSNLDALVLCSVFNFSTCCRDVQVDLRLQGVVEKKKKPSYSVDFWISLLPTLSKCLSILAFIHRHQCKVMCSEIKDEGGAEF